MFLLNTIPGTPPTGPTDGPSKLFETENKVESLEMLLRSIYLNEPYDYDLKTEELEPNPYVDNTDIDAIRQVLSETRNEEYNLLNTTGDTLEHDPSVRYNEVKSDEALVEQKIKELQARLDALNTESPNESENAEIAKINEELERLTEYKGELSSSDKFWSDVTSSHKIFEVSMQRKEQFFNGVSASGETSGGYNKLLELNGLLTFLESGKDGNNYDIDLKTEGIQKPQGITNLNDRNEIRNQILKLRTELLSQIPVIKDENWFKTFLGESENTLGKIDEEAIALQKKTDDLNQAFISLISGEVTEVTIGDIKYSSVAEVTNQLLNTNSYMQDLTATKEFLNQINKIASTNDSAPAVTDATKNLLLQQDQSLKIEQATLAMYRTLELQGLLTNLMVGRVPTFSVDGVAMDIDSISTALNQVKEHEVRLREEAGIEENKISELNLSFARKMHQMVDNRINDLNLTEKYLGEIGQIFYGMVRSLGYMVPDSYYLEDPNLIAVKMERQRVEEYKNGIAETEAYWNKITDDSKNQEEKPTTQPAAKNIAKTLTQDNERKVSNLREIFDFVSERESVENLKSREEEIKQEIEYQINKLNALVNNSPNFRFDKQKLLDEIDGLKSRLSGILQQKSHANLMEQIGNAVKETLSKESIYQGIYSSR